MARNTSDNMMEGMQTERLYELFRTHPHVTTDSRRISDGDIFFALHGENFDGNRFAEAALEAGASVAVVDDAGAFREDGRHVLVTDTLAALQQLARLHRHTVNPTVLAITGTNGKTTTKELVTAVLKRKFARLCHTRGNLNNHIGVPLTLLDMPFDCEMAIVEMGASACGEIALLCSIAEPDYGVITNIGNAHLEGFGGPEGVKRGKGELYDHLVKHGGRAFVRIDDNVLAAAAEERGMTDVIAYRENTGAGYDSHLVGDYNRFNIATAVAAGRHFGVAEEEIRAAIAEYVPSNNRSQMTVTPSNTLIVDCYNANPSSMRASIENFKSLCATEHPYKMMILGDMLELGEWSHQTHKEILELALESDCKKILLVGPNFTTAAEEFPCSKERIATFPDKDVLLAALKESRPANTTTLIKGSHSIGLENCIELF